MEIPTVFGWVVLLVVGMLVKSLSGTRYGWAFIAGGMLLLSVATLGYGFGMGAGREDASTLIADLEKACTAEYQASTGAAIPVERCRAAQGRARIALLDVRLNTLIGLAAFVTFGAALVYLGYQLEVLAARLKGAVVALPQPAEKQNDQRPAEGHPERDQAK